jgi:hypothetical protein
VTRPIDTKTLDRVEQTADPFAGDDEPWADEDVVVAWVADAEGGAAHLRFFRALALAVPVGMLAWAIVGAIAFGLYRLVFA